MRLQATFQHLSHPKSTFVTQQFTLFAVPLHTVFINNHFNKKTVTMSKNYFKQWMTALVLLTSVTGMANNLAGRGQNMSFEDLTAQGGQQTGSVANVPTGWNAYINGTQIFTADDVRTGGVTAWFGVNDDSEGDAKDGNYAFGLWNTNVPRFELSQTISGLDNGT